MEKQEHLNERQDRTIHPRAVASQEHFPGTVVRAQKSHRNKHQATSKAATLRAHSGSPEGAVLSLAQTMPLLAPDHLSRTARCF